MKQKLNEPDNDEDTIDGAGYLKKIKEKYEESIRRIEITELLKQELGDKYQDAARKIEKAVYSTDDYHVFEDQKGFINNSYQSP
jgi:hypothetical protein